MQKGQNKICTLAFLFLLTGFAKAQKIIVISDSLTVHGEKMNVKLGSKGPGKIWKMRFGDYAVVTSKMGWATKSVKWNFFDTKVESKTGEKFSFVLSNHATDTAWVNAANNVVVRALQEIEI